MLVVHPLYSHLVNGQPTFCILLQHILGYIPLLHEEQNMSKWEDFLLHINIKFYNLKCKKWTSVWTTTNISKSTQITNMGSTPLNPNFP
jgi:hypothetical protein